MNRGPRAGRLAALAATLPAVLAAALLAGCTAPAPTDESAPPIQYPGGTDGSTATATPTSEPASAADVEFMRSMLAHHAQAVTLAELAPDRAADEELRLFAERIAQAQAAELQMMVQWLQQRGLGTDAHAHDPATMPGGISATTMSRAETATGAQFDALFIPTMIDHHVGALVMAEERLAAGGDSGVTRLAESIIAGQQLEIDRLGQIGARLGIG